MNERLIRGAALSDQLNDLLSRQIIAGERPAGSRLPTESRLAEAFGVSRTVVREAIARLRADGLVVTRQGLGAFVTDSLQGTPFRLPTHAGATREEIRELFELRMGLETEAAALAAERASRAQVIAIENALEAMESGLQDGADCVDEDFQFHRAIATATNNGTYLRFLTFLESHIRDQLIATRRNTAQAGRTADINDEHRLIVAAIAGADPVAAREAARRHLLNGIGRLETMGQTADSQAWIRSRS